MSISLRPMSFGNADKCNTPVGGKIIAPVPKKPGKKNPQPLGGLITPPTPKKPKLPKNPPPMAGNVVYTPKLDKNI